MVEGLILKVMFSFLTGILKQLFAASPYAGGNGAVDSVPNLLLGRSDWTESQEDM